MIDHAARILTEAGIRVGEEYSAGARMEILDAVAAIGVREVDAAAGEAELLLRILSPRRLGGWNCQKYAVLASTVLQESGMKVQSREMTYQKGSDCLCVELTVRMPVRKEENEWVPGNRCVVFLNGIAQDGVRSFRAVRSQGRRLVGAGNRAEPVAVTPGSGGWELELVQQMEGVVTEPEEPFELTAQDMGRGHCYTGCCWNETALEYTQGGRVLTRRGFALTREEDENGEYEISDV